MDDLGGYQDAAGSLDGQEMAAPSSSLCNEVADNGTPRIRRKGESERRSREKDGKERSRKKTRDLGGRVI